MQDLHVASCLPRLIKGLPKAQGRSRLLTAEHWCVEASISLSVWSNLSAGGLLHCARGHLGLLHLPLQDMIGVGSGQLAGMPASR